MRKTSAQKSKAPVLGPEELFDLILAPKLAEGLQPGRIPIKPGVDIEDIGGGNWYVIANGKPVATYESREDAEQLARDW